MSDVEETQRAPARTADRRRVLDQLDVWRKELINLARSNRLLYFKHTKSSTLEIVREPDEAAEVVRTLLAGGAWRFYEPEPSKQEAGNPEDALFAENVPHLPGADELITNKTEPRALTNALRLLDRRATQEFMDKGIWILYLAAGVLKWVDPDTEETAESPLVLIPVVISRENPREPYELRRAEEDVVTNPALAVRLAEFGIELPTIDEDDFDLDEFLPEIERLIAGRLAWNVQPRLLISPFSFHKEVMYRDLLKNAEDVADHPLVQALAVGAEEGSALDFDPIDEERLDEEAPPEQVATILDADATQRQCIAAAAGGRSFVMDGPPGTGKSQTISNVIAELLAKGKTVLFVSEKAAALEVVQKRLRAAGLADYALELHSHKATRKEVAQQLGASLEYHPAVPPGMADTAVSKLLRRRKELTDRALAMNQVRMPLGRSLHEAIGRVAQLQGLPQAPPPRALDGDLGAEEFAKIMLTAGEIQRAWGPVARGEDFLWRELEDVRLDASRQQRSTQQVDAALAALASVARISADAADALLQPEPEDFKSSEQLLRVLKHLEERVDVPVHWLTGDDFFLIEARADEQRAAATEHEEASATLSHVIGSKGREIDPGLARRLGDSLKELLQLPFSLLPPTTASASALESVRAFAAESVRVLEEARDDVGVIADAFGLPRAGISTVRARELAELGRFAGETSRPEAEWLNPAVIDAVDHAARTLQPLCASFASQRDQLTSTFTDDVLSLDLEGLCDRFAHAHTGLGKLKSGYRADKKTLAAAIRTGKADKAAVSLLPQALEWQKLTRQLDQAEHDHAGPLGEHYYRRAETDFASISHALESAHRALEIAGHQLNATAMQRQLARGGHPDAQLIPAALRIDESLERWREDAVRILGSFGEVLASAELETASAWCRNAVAPLAEIAEVAAAVEQVARRRVPLDEVELAVSSRATVEDVEHQFDAAMDADKTTLGGLYVGLQTDWEALSSAVDWAKGLRDLLGGPLTSGAADRVHTQEIPSGELDAELARWYRDRDAVLANFLPDSCRELRTDLSSTFEDAASLLRGLAETVGDIDEWVDYQRALQQLDELGVGEAARFCVSNGVPSTEVPLIIERACLERWVDALIEREPERLKHLRADQLDPVVEEFRKLDAELIEHTAGRVMSSCNARRPRTTIGAAGVIKRESEKQRKHMPVRKLLEEAGEVAQALKPCFMMSPLTVSQFLPPTMRFDAVVFDEASQVRPSDAINCVYRGSQLIVAGDDKQLPPTSFFETVSMDGDDEWVEDQFDEFESILQLCKGSGGLRELPLRWHYRSQHEDLITYSNQAFYDGRLITFPGAAHETEDLGVKFFHVPHGIYRRGTARDNPREAEVVVDRIIHWARESITTGNDLTLGVVAFSEAQAAAIEVALDQRREHAPELDSFFAEDRLDGFFVKNLENVQGDERDVMIFSVGYGRDDNGKLTMNFGPLNRDGGKRRLNVAITRGRRRVEVIASITGKETEFGGELREGPRHLQRYLDYAARGPIALALEINESGLDAESPFEEEVIRTIRSWGFDVQPQVGTAGYRVDIGVKHPTESGRFALGVECDGRMYHSSKVARDRDRLRQEVLERLGWRIHRIWGTAWYRNRPEQETRLRSAIEAAISGKAQVPGRKRPKLEQPSWDDNGGFEAVALDEAPNWTTKYEVAQIKLPLSRRLEMHLPEAQSLLRQAILEVVSVEGPVRDEVVLRRVREAWNVGRAGHRIREAFDRSVAALARRGDIKRVGDRFLARDGDALDFVRVPGDDPEARRGVSEVPKSELALAVQHLVEDARRVSRDELTFQVARLFGWNRRGSDIAAALDSAVDRLLRDGVIQSDSDYVKTP